MLDCMKVYYVGVVLSLHACMRCVCAQLMNMGSCMLVRRTCSSVMEEIALSVKVLQYLSLNCTYPMCMCKRLY